MVSAESALLSASAKTDPAAFLQILLFLLIIALLTLLKATLLIPQRRHYVILVSIEKLQLLSVNFTKK